MDLLDHVRTKSFVRDILVNNAGMTQIGNPTETTSAPLAELSETAWDYNIAINLKTAFNITQAVLPFMLAANYGRIVNVLLSPALSSATLARLPIVRQKSAWSG